MQTERARSEREGEKRKKIVSVYYIFIYLFRCLFFLKSVGLCFDILTELTTSNKNTSVQFMNSSALKLCYAEILYFFAQNLNTGTHRITEKFHVTKCSFKFRALRKKWTRNGNVDDKWIKGLKINMKGINHEGFSNSFIKVREIISLFLELFFQEVIKRTVLAYLLLEQFSTAGSKINNIGLVVKEQLYVHVSELWLVKYSKIVKSWMLTKRVFVDVFLAIYYNFQTRKLY